MPSLFHKRRASDIPPDLPSDPSDIVHTPANPRLKWQPPADRSAEKATNVHSSPPGGKIRSFFRTSLSEESKEGMRRKLSSPSELFKRGSDVQRLDITSGWEEVPPATSGGGGAAARYSDAVPRSPNGPNGTFASPSVFPENFSLSQTASPEASPAAKKRGSTQWTPSYPLVLPEGEENDGDIAPDGQSSRLAGIGGSPVGGGGENEKRRSMDMRGRSLAEWEPLKPDVPKSTTPKPSTPTRPAAELPIISEKPAKPVLVLQTGTVTYDKAGQQPDTEPLLASEASSRRESEEPLVATPVDASAAATPVDKSPSTSFPPNLPQSVPASPLNPTNGSMVAPIPGMIIGPNGKMRPAMPSRRTTLIQSPPMPQPIKNLPTMQGWPGFNAMPGGPSTPGWGGMGKDAAGVPRTPVGLPRTPGWGGFGTPGPATPRTPGGGGFPFSTGGAASATKDKGKSAATEDELRKMRRAMPVMLRQASTKPLPADDGGGAGDDDEDDDDGSDTEVEGGADDDSDVETETEPSASPSSTKGKGKGKALSPLDRLKGKGKGKSSSSVKTAAPSSLSISTVISEEEENPAVPRKSPSLLERREKLSPPLLIPAPVAAAVPSQPSPAKKAKEANGEPKWSIGNERGTQGGWMSFGNTTPTWTPFKSASKTPKTPGMKKEASDEGYFGRVEISPPVEVVPLPDSEKAPLAPPITFDSGKNASPTRLTSPQHLAPIESPLSDTSSNTGEGNDGSDEGSEATSANTSLPQSPAIPQTRPAPVKRPSLYHQATQSLVDLRPRPSPGQDSPDSQLAEDISLEPTLAGDAVQANQLTPIKSGEVPRPKELPRRIEIPSRQQSFLRESAQTPGWLKAPPTPATPGAAGQVFWGAAGRKSLEESKPKPKRRRSAGDVGASGEAPPPDYEPPHPGVVIPRPRDDEGREKLPEYWCAVHIEGMLSRKMEFSAPGVQARDRSWKRYYCILRGTSLTLYKFDPRRFLPKEGAPPTVGPIPELEEEEHLHVHLPPDHARRGSVSGTQPGIHGSTIQAARRGSVGDQAVAGARRSSVGESTLAGTRRTSVSTASPLNPTGERARSGSVTGMGLPAGFDTGRRGSLTGMGSTTSFGQSSDSGSRRTSVSGGTGSNSNLSVATPASSVSAEKDPALFAKTNRRPSVGTSSAASSSTNTTSALAHFQTNHLVKTYTLQNAESGLAADYTKRKNVVRIRSEGEQFLLQTDGAREVVDWIEAFQAATNVALDLDDRPMPKIITLPRRRRRRPAAGAAATGAAAAGAVVGGADTPEANIRAVEAAERAQAAMDRDLAADQANPATAAS